MRKLLYWLSGRLPCRLINDGDRPYLERYYVGRLFGWTFYLHRFVASDPARGLHDHPWDRAWSLILSGWYFEETRAGLRKVRWFNRLTGDTFHRVVLPCELDGKRYENETCSTHKAVPCWTLFAHGPYTKRWGFLKLIDILNPRHGDQVYMWVPHAYQTDEASGKQRWWDTAPRGADEPRRMPA